MQSSGAASTPSLYSSLRRWQTRVLKLHAGRKHDALLGELLVADVVHMEGLGLVEAGIIVEYEAVSYTWGDAHDLAGEAHINGGPVAITRNLESALHHFRQSDNDRYLWVDALCINQADDTEKSEQVQEIFTIFRKAFRVLVWLGPGNVDVDGFLENLQVERDPWLPRLSQLEGPVTGKALLREHFKYEARPIQPSIDRWLERKLANDVSMWPAECRAWLLRTLHELCFHPWPQRIWVQQEVFAARTISMHCGHNTFTLETYRLLSLFTWELWDWASDATPEMRASCDAIANLVQASAEDLTLLEAARSRGTMGSAERARYYDLQADPKDLWTTLHRATHLKATEARDRIFALLPLTSCPTRPTRATANNTNTRKENWFGVDYTISPALVHQQLTKYFINRDNRLNFLHRLDTQRSRPDQSHLPGMPSWTPDWTDLGDDERMSSLFPSDRLFANYGPYEYALPWQKFEDIGILRVEGVRIGTVSSWISLADSVLGEFISETCSSGWDPSIYSLQLMHAGVSSQLTVDNPRHDLLLPPPWHARQGQCFHEPSGSMDIRRYSGNVLLSRKAQLGDIVVYLDRACEPLVLRPDGNKHLKLIGLVMEHIPGLSLVPEVEVLLLDVVRTHEQWKTSGLARREMFAIC